MSFGKLVHNSFLAVLLFSSVATMGCGKKNVETVPPTEQPQVEELSVLSVRPGDGQSNQATKITISGKGFKAGARVVVGDQLATDVAVPSLDTISAMVPAGLRSGTYNVTVRNPSGKEAILQGGFKVLEPPPAPDTSTQCDLTPVYFEFDVSNLSDNARSVLQKNGDCLRMKKASRIEVQGHTDERGSTDYNLALGQRRAEEVKRYLQNLGFSNVSSISYGEERPASSGNDEDAWSMNRRAEIIVND